MVLDELCAAAGWRATAPARRSDERAPGATAGAAATEYPAENRGGAAVLLSVLGRGPGTGWPRDGRTAAILRRFRELATDKTPRRYWVSAATIDRRLAPGAKLAEEARHAGSGSLLERRIPCAPGRMGRRGAGLVEMDLVGHEGRDATGAHGFTLTVTDIATG